jgi:hypothetical protein
MCASNAISRFAILAREDVRVDVRRDAEARMAEPLRRDVHRETGLPQQRGVRMPEVVSRICGIAARRTRSRNAAPKFQGMIAEPSARAKTSPSSW